MRRRARRRISPTSRSSAPAYCRSTATLETPAAEADAFDLVLIGNAMFGAAELKPALARAAHLVKPGGAVAMLGVGSGELLTFLFGMSSRWWDFTDIDLRTDSPLVAPEIWAGLFRDAGFERHRKVRRRDPAWPHWGCSREKGGAALRRDQRSGTGRLADRRASGQAADNAAVLNDRLDIQGHRVLMLELGGEFRRHGPDRFVAPVGDRQAYRTVLHDMAGEAGEARLNVVCFAGANAAPQAGLDGAFGIRRAVASGGRIRTAVAPRPVAGDRRRDAGAGPCRRRSIRRRRRSGASAAP